MIRGLCAQSLDFTGWWLTNETTLSYTAAGFVHYDLLVGLWVNVTYVNMPDRTVGFPYGFNVSDALLP